MLTGRSRAVIKNITNKTPLCLVALLFYYASVYQLPWYWWLCILHQNIGKIYMKNIFHVGALSPILRCPLKMGFNLWKTKSFCLCMILIITLCFFNRLLLYAPFKSCNSWHITLTALLVLKKLCNESWFLQITDSKPNGSLSRHDSVDRDLYLNSNDVLVLSAPHLENPPSDEDDQLGKWIYCGVS